jgi:hypothetical protein
MDGVLFGSATPIDRLRFVLEARPYGVFLLRYSHWRGFCDVLED